MSVESNQSLVGACWKCGGDGRYEKRWTCHACNGYGLERDETYASINARWQTHLARHHQQSTRPDPELVHDLIAFLAARVSVFESDGELEKAEAARVHLNTAKSLIDGAEFEELG